MPISGIGEWDPSHSNRMKYKCSREVRFPQRKIKVLFLDGKRMDAGQAKIPAIHRRHRIKSFHKRYKKNGQRKTRISFTSRIWEWKEKVGQGW